MCNTYTFYHTCGHTYLRMLISCPKAVDRAVLAAISPSLSPLLPSAPLSPPSPYASIPSPSPPCSFISSSSSSSNNDSVPTTVNTAHQQPTHSLPAAHPVLPAPMPPARLTPSLRHLRTLSACPTTPDALSIVPSTCTSCAALEAISGSLAGGLEERASFGLVDAWRKAEEMREENMRGRDRARSEGEGPSMGCSEAWNGGRRGRGKGRTVGVEDEELLRPVYFGVNSTESDDSEGSPQAASPSRGWRRTVRGTESRSGSESGGEHSTSASRVLSGHSVTSSRRRGIDAKTRIAGGRERIVSGFGPGW